MIRQLVVATRNRGKLKEIVACLESLVECVVCAADFEDFPETVEDGTTFAQNAVKKAREAVAHTGLPALADDSGLEVEALRGSPGVYSARFAGEQADDAANNLKLLQDMEHVEQGRRQAAFVCAMAFVTPEGREQLFTGKVKGEILDHGRGAGGFGYDPLFLVEGFGRTMAELTLDEKNRISHRGQALRQFRDFLQNCALHETGE